METKKEVDTEYLCKLCDQYFAYVLMARANKNNMELIRDVSWLKKCLEAHGVEVKFGC